MSIRQQEIAISEQVRGHYTVRELEALYDLADGLNDRARVVEIGVLYGRSASILMQVSSRKHFDLRFVDSWVLQGNDAILSFARLTVQLGVPYTLYAMRSSDVRWHPNSTIDLLHVDGDHSPRGIKSDCIWLSLVRSGGFAVFHDYLNTDFPQVKTTVDAACSKSGFELVGITDSQARFIKL